VSLSWREGMKTSKCIWKGCKETIQVNDEVEKSLNFISVVGWCKLHEMAYAESHKLFAKLDKSKHHSDIANDLYRNNRKKYNEIKRQGLKIAKKAQQNNSKVSRK
jgi:hypothetical protein